MDKCWEEIKDLLNLKICNSDIHISVQIQQNDKESLAAYMHRFKSKPKRCNFTNNAATIWIFVKGLKNAQPLAACVYKKGPQTLADAISEVEKLQAAQQLTATLLPLSTVHVMSRKEDQCFQCQALGHIGHHCPNIRCFECEGYGHIAADCWDKIPPSGVPAHPKRHHSNTRHHTRSTSRHHHRDQHRYNRSRSQSHSRRYWSHSHNNLHGSCSRLCNRHPNRSTSCHHHWCTYHYCHDTPHRKSSSHRSSSTHSRDCYKSRTCISYKPSKTTSSKPSSSSSRTTVKHQARSTIDDAQSDYYSSDDTSNDSEDDVN